MREIEKEVEIILRCRAISAAIAAFMLQGVLLCIYPGIWLWDFWHPFVSSYNFLSALFSIRLWLLFAPTFAAMLLASFSTLYHLSYGIKIARSRFNILGNAALFRSLTRFASYALMAAAVSYNYLNLTGEKLYHPCKERGNLLCLDHYNIFLVTCAFWTGVFYAGKRILLTRRIIKFPLIRQEAFLKLRDKFWEITLTSFFNTIMPIIYFLPVFYFGQKFIFNFFKWILSATEDAEASYFSIKLVLHSWLVSSVVYSSLKLMKQGLDCYLTQHLCLPVPDMIRLVDNMASQFMLELGLQDLAQLASGRGDGDVADLFAISHPGGVGHNWNTVLQKCMSMIETFRNELGHATDNYPAGPIPRIFPQEDLVGARRFPLGIRRLVSPNVPDPARIPPRPDRPWNHHHHQRQDEAADADTEEGSGMIAAFFRRFKPIHFFMAPIPELHIASLLENSQMVAFAVTTLAGLAAQAFTADKFGVVVNDLPDVVGALMSLHGAVHLVKKRKQHKNTDRASRMRSALRDACNMGLRRIAFTYADHLIELPLEPRVLIMLQNLAQKADAPTSR